MSFSIICEGTDISDYSISFERNVQICTGVGTLDFVVTKNVSISFTTWDTVLLYEEGSKKGTFNISTITREANTGNYLISCQDNSKRLVDYFITDYYEIDYYSTTRPWIEQFLTEAGLSYTITATTVGSPLSENTSLGMNSAYDTIIYLLQLSGWYIYFDEDGKAIVGELRKSNSPSKTFNDEILTIKKSDNDSMLRNKAVVWGNSGIIYSVETDTEWNYDSLDKRAVVFANSGVRDYATAVDLADTILEEFSTITEVTTAEIAGYFNIEIGDIIRLNAKGIDERGLLTTLNTSGSKSGFITTAIINERCPRLFGFFSPLISDYVYIGTYGYGVRRKRFSEATWEDFSTGMTNLNIVDLAINNDTMACINNSGELYIKYVNNSGWSLFTPGILTQTINHPAGEGFYHPFTETNYFFPFSGGKYISCAINRDDDSIYALFTTSGYTWFTTITSSGIYDHSLVVTSGEDFYYRAWDVESNSTQQFLSVAGLGYGSKNCNRNVITDTQHIKWSYYLGGFEWDTPTAQLIYTNSGNIKTIIDTSILNTSNSAPAGFAIDTNTLSDNQYLYSYSSFYNRYERWDYINDIRVYSTLGTFPDSSTLGTLLKGYDSPNYALAYKSTSSATYFQKVEFSGTSTNIASITHPTLGTVGIKSVSPVVVIETPLGFFAIWYVIRYDTVTLLPVDCIAFSFNIETYTYSSWTAIPTFSSYYFTNASSTPTNPSWYHNYCNPIIINGKVLFFPSVNPSNKGVNLYAKYGVILSIDSSSSSYLEYSELGNYTTTASALRPEAAISDVYNGTFFVLIDGYRYQDGYAKLYMGDYGLNNLTEINNGWDLGTVTGYSYPKAFRFCSGSSGAYRISQSGGILKLPEDIQVGQLEDSIYVDPTSYKEGNILGPSALVDTYYNRIYYILSGALKYYNLNDGSVGTILGSGASSFPIGNHFIDTSNRVYYVNSNDYSSEQNNFFGPSKVIVPKETFTLDERGYYYRNYDAVFESPYNANLECSQEYPLLVFTRGAPYFYSSEYAASGTFNLLIFNSVINDMRVLTVSGLTHIGIAGSGISTIPYTVTLSGNVAASGVTLLSGNFNRMETNNFGMVTTPYIFGSTIENFFQREIDSEEVNDYYSGSYAEVVTIIRVDDIV
jgi:hypothetical protein